MTLRVATDAALADRRAAKAAIRAEKSALADARGKLDAATQARDLIQAVAHAVETQAHEQITAVVTRCLNAVFPDQGYEFRIDFQRRRGKTAARLHYRRGGVDVDPASEDSGGVLQVAAFALRLACLLLSTPKRRKFLCLDEPFNAVSEDRRPAVAELLETLSKELEVQLLIVTHLPDLRVGKVVEIGGRGG